MEQEFKVYDRVRFIGDSTYTPEFEGIVAGMSKTALMVETTYSEAFRGRDDSMVLQMVTGYLSFTENPKFFMAVKSKWELIVGEKENNDKTENKVEEIRPKFKKYDIVKWKDSDDILTIAVPLDEATKVYHGYVLVEGKVVGGWEKKTSSDATRLLKDYIPVLNDKYLWIREDDLRLATEEAPKDKENKERKDYIPKKGDKIILVGDKHGKVRSSPLKKGDTFIVDRVDNSMKAAWPASGAGAYWEDIELLEEAPKEEKNEKKKLEKPEPFKKGDTVRLNNTKEILRVVHVGNDKVGGVNTVLTEGYTNGWLKEHSGGGPVKVILDKYTSVFNNKYYWFGTSQLTLENSSDIPQEGELVLDPEFSFSNLMWGKK